jgi:hypothetical protein
MAKSRGPLLDRSHEVHAPLRLPCASGLNQSLRSIVVGILRRPCSAIFRTVLMILLGSCVLAGAIGHLAGVPPVRTRGPQAFRKASDTLVDAHIVSEYNDSIHVLEPETGRLKPLALPIGESLFRPSFSPHRGNRQDVALAAGISFDRLTGEYFLTRMLLPGGEVLGRVPCAAIPAGALCWDPESPSRVLFASGDGQLHCASFDTAEPASGQAPALRPISWVKELSPGSDVLLHDPCWPVDACLSGRVLVSMRQRKKSTGRPELSAARLWWLKLDPERSTIVEAGPLEKSGDPLMAENQDGDLRYPSVSATAGGALVIAFQVFWRGHSTGELRVAPLRFDPRTGAPSILTSAAVCLVDGCVRMAPAFSSDGRRVACLVRRRDRPASALSLEVPPSLRSLGVRETFERAQAARREVKPH